ncbi:MAG TPA: hypothetical protein VG165_13790 [Solirubrobacteraceae bacterium]|jgi:hypothetical protein|nr:hypothetical protein [Solirubrobacteraceae bacterium]
MTQPATGDHERRDRRELAEEVRRIADDPADTAERRAVMEDMEALAAAWPHDPLRGEEER